ncbi:MAG: helix-turn-helix transcriptional regulator [Eubacteriales bacterium]|nr:helix-turn-helix transcriptional regulator [Eubacteriales bacterium]
MTSSEAVAERILELCKEKGIAVNTLANLAGVTPSTVYSMLNQKSNNPGIVTIQKLCDGIGITLHDFFNSQLFDNIEPVK